MCRKGLGTLSDEYNTGLKVFYETIVLMTNNNELAVRGIREKLDRNNKKLQVFRKRILGNELDKEQLTLI